MSLLVLKVGGAVATASAGDAAALADAGHDVCVVHGAGPQISAEMARRGLEVTFVAGRRVTTGAGLQVVRESLAEVNDALCAAIGERAVGLMGDEIGLRAVQVPALGLVGDPLPAAPPPVVAALQEGMIPVIAPLATPAVRDSGPGEGVRGNREVPPGYSALPSLNVNADEAAAALAVGLGAERIMFVTDVAGVYVDDGVVDALGADEADRLLDAGDLVGGIVPKLHAAVRAARLGVRAEIGDTVVTP